MAGQYPIVNTLQNIPFPPDPPSVYYVRDRKEHPMPDHSSYPPSDALTFTRQTVTALHVLIARLETMQRVLDRIATAQSPTTPPTPGAPAEVLGAYRQGYRDGAADERQTWKDAMQQEDGNAGTRAARRQGGVGGWGSGGEEVVGGS